MRAQAIILSFAQSGDTLRLTGHRRLDKVVPRAHPVADYRGRAGSWFEVDDAAGDPLYGRRLVNLFPGHHEVFDDQRAAHWLPRQTPVTTFEILAPLPPGAAFIAVFSSALGGAGGAGGAAREVFRLAVKDLGP